MARRFQITGLGALISRATDAADSPSLFAATLLTAGLVVTVNRLVWRRLYALSRDAFSPES
jgi:NitT/TauT family transport system permease protein